MGAKLVMLKIIKTYKNWCSDMITVNIQLNDAIRWKIYQHLLSFHVCCSISYGIRLCPWLAWYSHTLFTLHTRQFWPHLQKIPLKHCVILFCHHYLEISLKLPHLLRLDLYLSICVFLPIFYSYHCQTILINS